MRSQLFKQCELRRFVGPGRVERIVRWLPAEMARVGHVVTLDARTADGDAAGWDVVSAPEPALPCDAVRQILPDEESAASAA